MSRSKRKTPIFGIASSNAMRAYKRRRAKAERTQVRGYLSHMEQEVDNGPTFELKPWNEWDSPRDGKVYWKGATAKDMRK